MHLSLGMREPITTNDSRDAKSAPSSSFLIGSQPASVKLPFSQKKIHSVQRTNVGDSQAYHELKHNGNHLHPPQYIGHMGRHMDPRQFQQRQLPNTGV